MAVVNVPSGAWDTSVGWSLSQPDQVVLRSPGRTLVLSRSTGLWIGEIDIGIMKTAQEAQEVKAFIDELRGSANEFEIEMRDDAVIAGDPAAKVVSASISGGKVDITITSGVAGFQRGNMVRIANRAFRLVDDQAGSVITCLPAVAPSVGSDILYKGAKMLVRLRENPPVSYSDPDFTGPWTLRVQEAGL